MSLGRRCHMTKICMACGATFPMEPLKNEGVSHGYCNREHANYWLLWAQIPKEWRPDSLTDWYNACQGGMWWACLVCTARSARSIPLTSRSAIALCAPSVGTRNRCRTKLCPSGAIRFEGTGTTKSLANLFILNIYGNNNTFSWLWFFSLWIISYSSGIVVVRVHADGGNFYNRCKFRQNN